MNLKCLGSILSLSVEAKFKVIHHVTTVTIDYDRLGKAKFKELVLYSIK